jgi:hypoxanthine-guanine phosphoribosyltransferase
VNLINNNYHVIIDDYYFIFDGETIIEIYNTSNALKPKNIKLTILVDEKLELEEKIKAFLQTFNNNFINNTVFN